MKNSDLPAMPIPNKDIANLFLKGEKGGKSLGLTKREHFAGLAMAGMAADGINIHESVVDMAKDSVKWADALLAELDKGIKE